MNLTSILQISNYFQIFRYLQDHGKIISIFDYLTLDDTSFSQSMFP